MFIEDNPTKSTKPRRGDIETIFDGIANSANRVFFDPERVICL